MSDWWNQPTQPVIDASAADTAPAEPLANCPWCAQPATPNAGYCSGCGAVLAQHEDLGGLVVPGVTTVDPAMQSRGYTSSIMGGQSRMSSISLAGSMGGTGAQVALASVMLARDGLRGLGGSVDPESVGNASQAAVEMSRQLRRPRSMTESLSPEDDPMAPEDRLAVQTSEPEPDPSEQGSR